MSQPPDWSEGRDPSGFGQPPPPASGPGQSPSPGYGDPYGNQAPGAYGSQEPGAYGQYGEPYGQPAAGGPPREAHAGFWIRFLGALVDGILLSVVGGLVGAGVPDTQVWGPYSFLGLLLGAAYFGYLHSTKAGQTVGQRVCGIRLVDAATGGQVQPGAAILRWAMSYISGLPLFLGYLWMLWDPNKQTWHDKVASTYVVKASHYPPPAPFGQR